MRDVMAQQAHNQAAVAVPSVVASVAALVEIQSKNVVVQRERSIHKLVEQFLKLSPPRFSGTRDPEVTSLWIQDLEKAFALLMCIEAEKLTLAIYQLQGNANTWWRAAREIVFLKGVVPLWDAFLQGFNEQYFSKNEREQKIEEFM
ncbi:hypothetical protein ACJRO7_014883 [Eucalyptus globulus]|uniref:Retrotransposon gag domain-containing protein n=1 Tax=Eucalyptus globulus TaxID=34317 RepID=A0ABD3L1R4_EUCGL